MNIDTPKTIYKDYQSQNLTSNLSWNQKIKQDFILFQKKELAVG
jgi:hypothetical protein